MKKIETPRQKEFLHVNLTGQKVGKLTVIEKTDFRQRSAVMWNCRCDCGNFVLVRASHLTSRTRNSCGCLRMERVKGHKAANRLDFGASSFKRLIRQYKRHAKDRQLDFHLSNEVCDKLFKGDCYYCGCKPFSTIKDKESFGHYQYNGIDRIDNKKGYEELNVLSCCIKCNERKRTTSQDEFIQHVYKINKSLVGEVKFPLVNNSLPEIIDIKGSKNQYLPGVASRNLLIKRYKNDAKDRKLEFLLSKEQCVYLFKQDCYYCEQNPSQVSNTKVVNGPYIYSGIDRVDNTRGYAADNCVSCCKKCNIWKTNWPLKQLRDWASSIVTTNNARLSLAF